MSAHSFRQVDVFSSRPLGGNPVAVVHGADGLDEARMAAFARWTNLSETTFLLDPTPEGAAAGADYRLRIFTPGAELPFAGHPTLGSAHAWLEAGGVPRVPGRPVQECGAGMVGLRQDAGGRLSFAAPPLRRGGPVAEEVLVRVARALRVERAALLDARWCDNGPGWVGVRLADASAVLALEPDPTAFGDLEIGVVGTYAPGEHPDGAAIEVRAFCPGLGVDEDPVTGSLNAALAQWLAGGLLPAEYTAAQGTVLGRQGRVHVVREPDPADPAESAGERVWVGGDTCTTVTGTVTL
ncbi:PhzF family phenazine biosynthesis protein [Nocardioides sp. GY 10127]|uniref:PhzF family phenazine biosynthesis protein n=1 Tax=Nocardioides sp. GY 10127 TaxID=2569762 RepID=UPI0010A7FD5E|nr:PhzF family phenazine biosynthesis protein [Nocardioides sp. GY 10127]TIC85577.1 PhzF family phenazine biosynthesis protein [Nocardioides sp. GY 10127]